MKDIAPKFIMFGVMGISLALTGQTTSQARIARDRRLENAITEIAVLKKTAADQDQRIHDLEKQVNELEKQVKSLSIPVEAAALHPLQKAPSKRLEVWQQITIGMSRVQVEDLLGKPTSVDSVIDHQTLYYADPAAGSGVTPGTVQLTGDRVTDVTLPGR